MHSLEPVRVNNTGLDIVYEDQNKAVTLKTTKWNAFCLLSATQVQVENIYLCCFTNPGLWPDEAVPGTKRLCSTEL